MPKLHALIVLAIIEVLSLSPVLADQLVSFKSAPYRLGQLQQRLAQERGDAPERTSDTVEGWLSKPEGNGPFGAIVLLHGCSGLHDDVRKHFAELATGWGYVLLAVDSLATRGIKQSCTRLMPARQGDALGALAYLSGAPFVDPRRVVVIGSSQGGDVALDLASEVQTNIFDVPEGLQFKAAVAYYPLCSVAGPKLEIPTLIMIGELDDWSAAHSCETWMKTRRADGAAAKLIVYQGAYHAFDVPDLAKGVRAYGHWLKYDADAARRSVLELQTFLASQLSSTTSR
ncbi:dienelactone hydrolase family protein [Bradyrhizobium sp. ORS 285]|uniref:dienelactone hydrolase family protein n=1 Tax=Bradyrhizobium sp. ORS 285 TaxID=115808 RepID=UPI0007C72FA5|nr:dienelactone hydrolase family protein [Bradyrhizobium sp. ORS 285]